MSKLTKTGESGWAPWHRHSTDDHSEKPLTVEQDGGVYDNSPLPRVTWASFTMGVLVSMGGFIFGYDTGQISGFLGMEDFQQRFGQFNHSTGLYYFSNVRAGLIVALVSAVMLPRCMSVI